MIGILAVYLYFEGANNIHVLYVLIWGFGGCWIFLTHFLISWQPHHFQRLKIKKSFRRENPLKLTMSTHFVAPGGGTIRPNSYAKRLKTTKFEKLNRNLLEILLEKKTIQKNVNINGEEVAKVCQIIGLKVGSDTEGYQAHYNRKVITLAVWAKAGVSLEKFVREDPIEFNGDLTITQVRSARRREVTLLITGLPFNTPDAQVKHYVESFGAKINDSEPTYGVHKEGPW